MPIGRQAVERGSPDRLGGRADVGGKWCQPVEEDWPASGLDSGRWRQRNDKTDPAQARLPDSRAGHSIRVAAAADAAVGRTDGPRVAVRCTVRKESPLVLAGPIGMARRMGGSTNRGWRSRSNGNPVAEAGIENRALRALGRGDNLFFAVS